MTDTSSEISDEVIDSRPPDTPLQAARDLAQAAEDIAAKYPGLDVRVKDPLPEGLPGSDGELTGEAPAPTEEPAAPAVSEPVAPAPTASEPLPQPAEEP